MHKLHGTGKLKRIRLKLWDPCLGIVVISDSGWYIFMWDLLTWTSKQPPWGSQVNNSLIQWTEKSIKWCLQFWMLWPAWKCFLRSVIMCVSYFCRLNLQLIIPFSRLFIFSELAKWVYKMIWIDLNCICLDHSLSESPEAVFSVSKRDIIKKKEQILARISNFSLFVLGVLGIVF